MTWSDASPWNARAARGSDRDANLLMGHDGMYNAGDTAPGYLVALNGYFDCKPPSCVTSGAATGTGPGETGASTTTAPQVRTLLISVSSATLTVEGTRMLRTDVDMTRLGKVYDLDPYLSSSEPFTGSIGLRPCSAYLQGSVLPMPMPERATARWVYPQNTAVEPPPPAMKPTTSASQAWATSQAEGLNGDGTRLILAVVTQQLQGQPTNPRLNHQLAWLAVVHDVPQVGFPRPASPSGTSTTQQAACPLGERVAIVNAETGQLITNMAFGQQVAEPLQ